MRYIAKPRYIEAVQYTGDNFHALMEFCGNHCQWGIDRPWVQSVTRARWNKVHVGDYVTKDQDGHFFIWSKEAFECDWSEDTSLPTIENLRVLAESWRVPSEDPISAAGCAAQLDSVLDGDCSVFTYVGTGDKDSNISIPPLVLKGRPNIGRRDGH